MRVLVASLPLQRVLWTAGVIIGASLPHWRSLPFWIPALLCACVAWRIDAERRRRRLPGVAVRACLALLALAGVLAEYRTVNGLAAGSALLVVMVALKYVEARTERDQLVLMIVAYFLVFASLLEQQSMAIGAYLFTFVFVTTGGLLQLARRGPLLAARVIAALAGRMLLQALPVMAVLFVLFPRLPGPLWSLPSSDSGATSGLSETMSPGDITELAASDDIAFRVEFLGRPPAAEQLYWRGPVLERFDGKTWSRRVSFKAHQQGAIEYRGEPVEYRVMLEPEARDWAFALEMPREWSEMDAIVMSREYQLLTRPARRRTARLDYRVLSHTDYRTLEPPTEGERRRLTALPNGAHPRSRELVASWRSRGLSPEQIAASALALFHEQPFRYTLAPPALHADPADEFLFDTRAGFCEHFASAFAVLMRAAGIPARVVTGYLGAEHNEIGGYHIIRQSNAHAWVEIWLAAGGWTRVDPTAAVAPERIEIGPAETLLGRSAQGHRLAGLRWVHNARLAWDALNVYWYGWFIGYGEATQRLLLERLGLGADSPGALLAGAVAAALSLASLIGWLVRAHGRGEAMDASARCYGRWVRRLARRGVEPPRPGEAPTAYAQRAERALPASAPAICGVVAAYLRARYEPDPEGESLRRLCRLTERFERPRR